MPRVKLGLINQQNRVIDGSEWRQCCRASLRAQRPRLLHQLVSNLVQVFFVYFRPSRLEDGHLRSLHLQERSTAKDYLQ